MLKLESPAFTPDGNLPLRHTCLGPDLSPPLAWSGRPARARSWALVCRDPEWGTSGEGWTHWVAYGLPASLSGLPEGVPPLPSIEAGGFQGLNSFGRSGWAGPCPKPDDERRLVFTLYAVSKFPELAPNSQDSARDLLSAILGWTIAKATLAARFRRS